MAPARRSASGSPKSEEVRLEHRAEQMKRTPLTHSRKLPVCARFTLDVATKTICHQLRHILRGGYVRQLEVVDREHEVRSVSIVECGHDVVHQIINQRSRECWCRVA